MTRSVPPFVFASALCLLLALAGVGVAQDSARGDQANLGSRLFNQSCSVCHLQQQLGTKTYAPALSQDTLGGKADAIHEIISNGTPNMPGFKIQFTPTQIDAIVAYIKTVPVAAVAPQTGKSHGPGEPD
jgi:mono/diheme cytochrome c family protein